MTCEHDEIAWSESMNELVGGLFSKRGKCQECGFELQEVWEYHGKHDLKGNEI